MEDSDIDNGSDLDLPIEELARRPAGTHQSSNGNGSNTVSNNGELLIEEDNDNPPLEDVGESSNEASRRNLRRRRNPINYKGMDVDSDEEFTKIQKRGKPTEKSKNILDLTTLLQRGPDSEKGLQKYIRHPGSSDERYIWELNTRHFISMDTDHFELVKTFVEKCGRYAQNLVITTGTNRNLHSQIEKLLSEIFKIRDLLQLTINYDEVTTVSEILDLLLKSGNKSVTALRIGSLDGTGILGRSEIELLCQRGKWVDLDLGDGISHLAGETLRKLLELGKDCLERVVIHGGFKGPKDTEVKLNFTREMTMSRLKELQICPKYTFASESFHNWNSSSKRWREVRLDHNNDTEDNSPCKLILNLEEAADFPELKELVLGNIVDLEGCPYKVLKKLTVFKCGSRWDFPSAVIFPKLNPKPSPATELQFPDMLNNPSFVKELSNFFPNVRKVTIKLPTVPVLRAFFKNFKRTPLEELHLTTQFDFDTMLESCLLPKLKYKLSQDGKEKVKTLKEYKHFEAYQKRYNIELPVEDEETLEIVRRSGAGIRKLKFLKVLHLEHIPRELFIPNPEDERLWYDHNFKWLSTPLGFMAYPFSERCQKELQTLPQKPKIIFKEGTFNFHGHSGRAFRAAGYTIDRSGGDIVCEVNNDMVCYNGRVSSKPTTPTKVRNNEIKVAIKPSHFIPNHFKNKNERD